MTRFLKIMSVIALSVMALTSCGKKATAESAEPTADTPKAIICYFSATGTTKAAAERIASLAGADILEIIPAEPYTDADLDWRDSLSRSSVEMRDLDSRPALNDSVANLEPYSVVFIGYPNWWNSHPTIINTFIEANNLEGKTIVPFMTSGGSKLTNSQALLREQYPSLTIADGLLLNDVTDDDISAWLKTLSL